MGICLILGGRLNPCLEDILWIHGDFDHHPRAVSHIFEQLWQQMKTAVSANHRKPDSWDQLTWQADINQNIL